jgi:endonuclease YncB( thermonuclease family)
LKYEYQAVLHRVIDGDTIEADIDIGFYMGCRQRLRLLAYDAPENKGDTKEAAQKATHALIAMLPNILLVRTYKADSFGRWLCTIESGGQDLGFMLYALGHGTWDTKQWEKHRGTDRPGFIGARL